MLRREGYASPFSPSGTAEGTRTTREKRDRDLLPWSSRRWLQPVVSRLDRVLRRWQSIIEYTSDPNCILRIKLERLDADAMLSDGTRARAGDRIVDLHLWNEQVPRIPERGASIAWARRMHLCFQLSLRELARYLASRPGLDDVSVIRCNMAFGGAERNAQMVRLIGRYGFELAPRAATTTMRERLRRFGENILISLMVLAHNAEALRRDSLRRGRAQVLLSRRVLEGRYGRGACCAKPERGST
ncbi:MAG: hypothetical protein WBW74_10095 [Xanthobacteraceae bacterium]